jgi:hypothetical protein
MPQASLIALLSAYRDQSDWLETQAAAFETGQRKLLAVDASGSELDLSAETAQEYRHKAGNLQAIIIAYERLHAKGS